MRIHHFGSSGEAYDTCQWNDEIKSGDILVIEDEQVVGVAWTWPIAVSKNRGEFHPLKVPEGMAEKEALVDATRFATDPQAVIAGYAKAIEIANQRGWR